MDADPSRTSKSRRVMDVIGMLVGIYGSKELFVNEYRVMLAEKLLNKSDYDTDRNIRTLELLKVSPFVGVDASPHPFSSFEPALVSETVVFIYLLQLRFGENNMHGCEIMLKDVADSKRINSNIKVSKPGSEPAPATPPPQTRASRSLSGQAGTSGGAGSGGSGGEQTYQELSMEVVDATIISSLFWPPFQVKNCSPGSPSNEIIVMISAVCRSSLFF